MITRLLSLLFKSKIKHLHSGIAQLRGSINEIHEQCGKLCTYKGIVITSVSICKDFEEYGHTEQFVALIPYYTYE